MLHEGGHAVALRRMAAEEGLRTGPIAWGISFHVPAAGAVRRCLGGMDAAQPVATRGGGAGRRGDRPPDASLAAIGWAMLGPGRAARPAVRHHRDLRRHVAAVQPQSARQAPWLLRAVGFASGVPNLLARAQAALGRFVLGPFGLVPRPHLAEAHLALYALASWAYRWTIYIGVFWLAGGVHWLLAGAVRHRGGAVPWPAAAAPHACHATRLRAGTGPRRGVRGGRRHSPWGRSS